MATEYTKDFVGDFLGFSFNGKHSSKFNIVRVSDGSRYTTDFYAPFQDQTMQVPGRDGSLYWTSTFTNRTWNISIAFDNLTEGLFKDLRYWLKYNVVGDLIFDEWPYKRYIAKIQSPPQLKYLCFDKQVGSRKIRVYKGEGTIQFISYYPYALSVNKYLNDYYSTEDEILRGVYTTINQWKAESQQLLVNIDNLVKPTKLYSHLLPMFKQAAEEAYSISLSDEQVVSLLRVVMQCRLIDPIECTNEVTNVNTNNKRLIDDFVRPAFKDILGISSSGNLPNTIGSCVTGFLKKVYNGKARKNGKYNWELTQLARYARMRFSYYLNNHSQYLIPTTNNRKKVHNEILNHLNDGKFYAFISVLPEELWYEDSSLNSIRLSDRLYQTKLTARYNKYNDYCYYYNRDKRLVPIDAEVGKVLSTDGHLNHKYYGFYTRPRTDPKSTDPTANIGNIYKILLYNPGLPTDWSLRMEFTHVSKKVNSKLKDKNETTYDSYYMNAFKICLRKKGANENKKEKMRFKKFYHKGADEGIIINSSTNLIEGYIKDKDTGKITLTGNFYNEYLQSGAFFQIPKCLKASDDKNAAALTVESTGKNSDTGKYYTTPKAIRIDYDYLYY